MFKKESSYDYFKSSFLKHEMLGATGPPGRRVLPSAPLTESAHQVRDSPPALCLPDVMDVAWSPHDAWLASCSVDNTVVIWNAVKFPGLGL